MTSERSIARNFSNAASSDRRRGRRDRTGPWRARCTGSSSHRRPRRIAAPGARGTTRLRTRARRSPAMARRLRHALAAEALLPFLGRAVRDHAELARQAHAEPRAAARLVVAAAPGRIAADDLALQRAQRDRERRRAGRAGNRHEVVDFVGKLHAHTRARSCRRATARARRRRVRCRATQHLVTRARDVLDRELRETSSRTAGPCAGRSTPGSSEPNGLPSELMQMTKKRRVSIGRPSPIIDSHQPGVGSAGDDAACADGDSPVKIRRALSRASFSSPQVSYATTGCSSTPPRYRRIGASRMASRVAGNSSLMTGDVRGTAMSMH